VFGTRITDRICADSVILKLFRVGEKESEMKEKSAWSVALKVIGAIILVSAIAVAVAVIIKKISDKKKAEAARNCCDDDFCDCGCECDCECECECDDFDEIDTAEPVAE
jgi:hypothetical protein